MTEKSVVPYVVGQWVRGGRFYGRRVQMSAVLGGERPRIWLVGTRRVGKTSLLRQLELVASDLGGGLFPVYWDLEGADEPDELAFSLSEALADADALLHRAGVRQSALSRGDVTAVVRELGRLLEGRNLALLLLCDEAEELMALEQGSPGLAAGLARELESRNGARWVLASSPRLRPFVDRLEHGSPSVRGLVPPVFVGPLEPDEACCLVRQAQLPPSSRPRLADGTVHDIAERCGNHPYLLQLLGKRMLELGDLEAACAAITRDRTVDRLFSVDRLLLAPRERDVLRVVVLSDPADSDAVASRLAMTPQEAESAIRYLADLGMIRRYEGGGVGANDVFHAGWARRSEAEDGGHREHDALLGNVDAEVEL